MIVEFYVEVNPNGCMAWESVDSPLDECGMGKTPHEAISDLCLLLNPESRPTPLAADALPCGHSMGTVESDNYIVCSVCGRHVRR